MTGSFTDTYVINSSWTNEFRFNYGRIGFNFRFFRPILFTQLCPIIQVSASPVLVALRTFPNSGSPTIGSIKTP